MPRQVELKRLDVVAGILCDAHRRVLLAERVEEGPLRGLWEFPGGKIDAGESAETALVRELVEEIGVRPLVSAHFLSLDHDYADRQVSIDFFLVTKWRNKPVGLDRQQLRWVEIETLSASQLLPADAPVIDALLAMRLRA